MFKELLHKMYQRESYDVQINEVYETLFHAALLGLEYAYFFEFFDGVRRTAREEGLLYETLDPNETESGVRCVRVWGWSGNKD